MGKAKPETMEQYRAMGRRYAAQGQARHPDCDPLEALCRHAEDRVGVLKPSTVRLYKRRYGAAALVIGRTEGVDEAVIIEALRRLTAKLDAMSGTPAEKRTSSKKVKDAKDWVVKEVFGHLKIMAVRHRRIRSAAVGLYCLLVPKLGVRPVELTGAWVEGDTLFVPSAKQPEGGPSVRRIDISDFHPTHKEALLALIFIVARDVEAGGYDAWLSRLAETLARACVAVARKPVRRLTACRPPRSATPPSAPGTPPATRQKRSPNLSATAASDRRVPTSIPGAPGRSPDRWPSRQARPKRSSISMTCPYR